MKKMIEIIRLALSAYAALFRTSILYQVSLWTNVNNK